jgi:leucyl-tRNA synthetase
MKKLLHKQESGSKKPKKGAVPAPPSGEKKKISIGLICMSTSITLAGKTSA